MSVLDNNKACWSLYSDDPLQYLSNIDVERTFLCTLLNAPSILNEFEDKGLKLPHAYDFSHPTNGLLFAALKEFVNRYGTNALKVSTLSQFIADNKEMFTLTIENKLFEINDYFLANLIADYRSLGDDPLSTKYNIDIIMDLSQRRKMHNLMISAQNTNINPNGKSVADIAYGIQDEVSRVIDSNDNIGIQHKCHSDTNAAIKLFQKIKKELETDTVDMGLPTGINSIDELIGGLLKGTFNILAARPGIGKTALACQIAYHNARIETQKRPVFIFSLEMTLNELELRRFASVAKTNLKEIKAGMLSNSSWLKITKDIKCCGDKVSIFTEISSISPIEIRSALNSFIRTNNGLTPCLIIIDYFQLMTLKVNEPLDPQYAYADYKKIAQELKSIAQEYDLAVLALSQVGRSPSGRNELPTAEQLKGCIGINEVADLTFFLHRPDVKNNEDIIVSVAKNRNGLTGETTICYDGPHFTFYDK